MRKRILALLTLIVTIFVFTGCAVPRREVTKRNIKTSYSEWVSEIGLLDGRYLTITKYAECDDGLIIIDIDYNQGEGEQAFIELSELIDKSNGFVRKNPNYFPQEAYVNIGLHSSGGYLVCFFSKGRNAEGLSATGEEIGRSDDMTIQYAFVDMQFASQFITDYNVNYSIPVVLLRYYNGPGPSESYYRILEHFNGAEQVLLDYKSDEEGFIRCKGYAQKYAPGVEVYKYTDGHFILIE